MAKILLSLFVKNYRNVEDADVRQSYGRIAGVVGIVSNLLLSITKVSIGLLVSSLAVIADGINNLADTSSSIITLVGFKLSSMPEDEEHPYGHARIEYLTGVIIAVTVVAVGLSLGKISVEKIISPNIMKVSTVSLVIMGIAVVIKCWQSLFYFDIAKRISSSTIKAAGIDSRNDVLATLAVVISLLIYMKWGINIDGVLGLFVAGFIVWSGISLIKETASPLLGEAPDQKLVDNIVEMITTHEGVLGVHDLILHSYGKGNVFGSIHVEVDAAKDILISHELVDLIESKVEEKFNIKFVTHMDPVVMNSPIISKVIKPLKTYVNDTKGISNLHDLRAVIGENRINIIFEVEVDKYLVRSEEEIRKDMNSILKEIDKRFIGIVTFHRGYSSI